MRLIDVDALIEKHCEGCSKDIQEGCKTDPVCATLMWFEDAPTIDAVPGVRCKDCKYWQDNNGGYPHDECRWGKGETPDPDDYCSYGERKEEAIL